MIQKRMIVCVRVCVWGGGGEGDRVQETGKWREFEKNKKKN